MTDKRIFQQHRLSLRGDFLYPVRKRFAAAAALMMLSAVSCADGDKPADETAPTGTAAVTTAESTASQTEQQSETSETVTEHIVKPIDNSVPVTFTFYSCAWDEDSAYDEAVTEKITELTGVTLEMIYPSSDDLFSDLMAMKASGDLPDLIYAGEYTEKLVSQKIFSPLDTLIDDYGGNFKAMYGGQEEALRHPDGRIYTVGTGGAYNVPDEITGMFSVQHRVLKDAGYPQIRTLDELEELINGYLEKYPNNPSGARNRGLLLCGKPYDDWERTVGGRVLPVLGYPAFDGDFIVNDDDGSAVYKYRSEGAKKYFKWLNHMYNRGLLSDQSFSLKRGEYLDVLDDGNVLAVADGGEHIKQAEDLLNRQGLAERTYFPLGVTLDSGMTDAVLRSSGFDGREGIGISASCSEPERAFAFLDAFCSDEIQQLVSSDADTGFGYPFPSAGSSPRETEEYPDIMKETLNGFGIVSIRDMFAPTRSQPYSRHGAVNGYDIGEDGEAAIIQSSLGEYVHTEISAAIMLPEDEFDAKWDEIQAFLEASGAGLLEKDISALVKDNIRKRYGG